MVEIRARNKIFWVNENTADKVGKMIENSKEYPYWAQNLTIKKITGVPVIDKEDNITAEEIVKIAR